MTGDELKAWMTANGWTVRGLAAELKVAPSSIDRWRDDTHPIPETVVIALHGPALADRTPPPPGTGGGGA